VKKEVLETEGKIDQDKAKEYYLEAEAANNKGWMLKWRSDAHEYKSSIYKLKGDTKRADKEHEESSDDADKEDDYFDTKHDKFIALEKEYHKKAEEIQEKLKKVAIEKQPANLLLAIEDALDYVKLFKDKDVDCFDLLSAVDEASDLLSLEDLEETMKKEKILQFQQ
jgi:hypothetical protein